MFEAPDYVEPLIGWRAWLLLTSLGKPRLASVTRLWCKWPYRLPLEAVNWPDNPRDSGIYAFKRRDDLDKMTTVCNFRYTVLGQVHLWGEIVEHRLGYRATFAYPKSLEIQNPALFREYGQVLQANYGVPVTVKV